MKTPIFMLLATALVTQPSWAGAIRISPVTLDMDDTTTATSLSLVNDAPTPANLQIRIFKWEQNAAGEDQLLPTKEMVVSPPFIKMQPSNSYNVRVVKLDNRPVDIEQAYRIIIDELPTPNDSRKVTNGIGILIRSSLPVFVLNKNAIAELTARWVTANHQPAIEITNNGKRHTLLEQLAIIDPQTQQPTQIKVNTVNGYILAGHTKRYALPNTGFNYRPNTHYQILLKSNGQTITF